VSVLFFEKGLSAFLPVTPPPRHLVFYGNCQMQVLAQAYELFVVPHTGETATHISALRPPTEASRHVVARADIMIEQITPMADQPPLGGVQAGARRLRVPLVDGSFLWPFSGTRHPESQRRYGAYHPFPAEMGDSFLLRAMAGGASGSEAVRAYAGADVVRLGHAARRQEIALELQTRREAGTSYRFASLIETHLRTERLFRTPYHLDARLSRHMLMTLLDDLETAGAARHAVGRFYQKTMFGGLDLPIHPAIAAYHNLDWADGATRHAFWREEMLTFEDYAHRFVQCRAYPIMDAAVQATMRAQPGAEALLDAALADLPNSPWGLHARATLHLRARDFAAAHAVLRRVLDLHPGLGGAYASLHDALLGLGRTEDAIAALREEVRRQPHRIPHRVRLMQHGDTSQIEAILALQPNHALALKRHNA
jgi:hypothetical protein